MEIFDIFGLNVTAGQTFSFLDKMFTFAFSCAVCCFFLGGSAGHQIALAQNYCIVHWTGVVLMLSASSARQAASDSRAYHHRRKHSGTHHLTHRGIHPGCRV